MLIIISIYNITLSYQLTRNTWTLISIDKKVRFLRSLYWCRRITDTGVDTAFVFLVWTTQGWTTPVSDFNTSVDSIHLLPGFNPRLTLAYATRPPLKGFSIVYIFGIITSNI